VYLPPVLIGVNELPPGYPWSGCSPAEPASVSPGLVVRLSNERIMSVELTGLILAQQREADSGSRSAACL
jgi:hypothetical protein